VDYAREVSQTPAVEEKEIENEFKIGTPAILKKTAVLYDKAKTLQNRLFSRIPGEYHRTMIEALITAAGNADNLIEAIFALEPEQQGAIAFLISNMPKSDLQSLSAGFLVRNVKYAFKARRLLPYVGKVPEDIFLNYVLPYACEQERRDEWRPDFYDRFHKIAKQNSSVEETVVQFNREVFRLYKLNFGNKNRPRRTWSPYQSMENGFVSCQDASIMLIDACRAVGIPARLVILPSWRNTNAGHSWPEVYDNGRWRPLTAWDPARLDDGWVLPLAVIVLQTPPPKPKYRLYAVSFKKTDLHIQYGPEVSLIDVSDAYLALGNKKI